MLPEPLPTDLLVAAQRRIAAQSGIPMVLVRKGATASGAIFLKINRLDGTASLYAQARMDDEVVWLQAGPRPLMDEREADAILARQAAVDDDLWIVEIEDREGRLWFPGRVMESV